MRDTTTHRRIVISFWEWTNARGDGALSSYHLEHAQRAKLDERLDRIQELPRLDFQSIQGLIYPFRRELKKIKIPGNIALRPIVVRGPGDVEHELTFLLVTREENRVLLPSSDEVESLARERLADIEQQPARRRRYGRS